MDSSADCAGASFPLLSQASCHELPSTEQFSNFSTETKSHCCHKLPLAWASTASSSTTTTVITGSSRTSCSWETGTTLSTIAYSSSPALIRSPGSSLDAQKLLWILNYYYPEFTKEKLCSSLSRRQHPFQISGETFSDVTPAKNFCQWTIVKKPKYCALCELPWPITWNTFRFHCSQDHQLIFLTTPQSKQREQSGYAGLCKPKIVAKFVKPKILVRKHLV